MLKEAEPGCNFDIEFLFLQMPPDLNASFYDYSASVGSETHNNMSCKAGTKNGSGTLPELCHSENIRCFRKGTDFWSVG